MNSSEQIVTLQIRLRMVRESRNLTLVQAAALSRGSISAVALGSYERGDRAISASKLAKIATMYGVPIGELFLAPEKNVGSNRITVDLRKLRNQDSMVAQKFSIVIDQIARMRSDWNGEFISLRGEDLKNLVTFSGFTSDQVELICKEISVPRSK
jgi:transcriptional regulator with XRE-family HTH domain